MTERATNNVNLSSQQELHPSQILPPQEANQNASKGNTIGELILNPLRSVKTINLSQLCHFGYYSSL